MQVIIFLLLAVAMTGCANMQYQVYVYNGTPTKITEAKVMLSKGETLTFGTLDPAVGIRVSP